jgi:hypothetical protein
VEDRTEPGLWLELVSKDASDYAQRANDLVGHPGISSAWWGNNSSPGRTDLPRKVADFPVLGVFEVDGDFEPPSVPDYVTGIHFARTQRPGQGILTGEQTTGILLVLISPRTADGAVALRDWADFVHIRYIAEVAVPGYTMITPYENASGGDPLYLHLYEMNSEDPEQTFQSMRPLVEQRLGPQGTMAFDAWAWHEQLRIMYVNTFARAGVIPPDR